MIFMAPITGVCFDFQFGKCDKLTHHEKEDGELQLHLCQPCYQIRQLLVHHSCSGRHPGHSGHGHGQIAGRRIGAVGCPAQMNQLPLVQTTTSPPNNNYTIDTTSSSPSNNNTNTTFSSPSSSQTTGISTPSCQCCGVSVVSCFCVKYKHQPDAMCPCDSCTHFVRIY